MDISLKQLEMFRAVVVAGSITKASRRMGLSQPSISQQLAKLEEMLGTPLLRRNRTGLISLTPAGEYWFRTGDSMLQQMENSVDEHRQRFIDNSVSLHIGVTPTLRGRFVAAAARIAREEPGFTKFDLFYGLSSAELVEKLRLHQLNCAIINVDALAEDRNSFVITDIFQDQLAWVVPSSVPAAEVRAALKPGPRGEPLPEPLGHFVDVYSNQQLRAQTEEWYRHHLPGSSPTFRAITYAAATDIVAAGLATAHCPMSMLPNLPDVDRVKLQFIPTEIVRNLVLVMPKHLLTLPSYANIYRRLVDFCRDEYREEMKFDAIRLVTSTG
ncbi:MAG: LysR family transcriptional regulator [Hyphomicrobiales bacterium]|nr:MAG: LysR family transcriptional regulator [Hyphomicrobiales bacterium]